MNSTNDNYYYIEERLGSLGEQLGRLELKLEQTEMSVQESRLIIVRLVERLAAHDLLDDQDRRWLKQFLGPQSRGTDVRQATAKAAHQVIGKIRCACGATVDDIRGVTEEQCPWCGAILATSR